MYIYIINIIYIYIWYLQYILYLYTYNILYNIYVYCLYIHIVNKHVYIIPRLHSLLPWQPRDTATPPPMALPVMATTVGMQSSCGKLLECDGHNGDDNVHAHISCFYVYTHNMYIYIYIIHMYCIYIYDIYIYMYYLHVLYQHWPQQKRKYQASTSCYETLGARNSQKEQPQKARNQGTAQRRERGGRCSKELVGNAAQDTHSKLGDKSDKWEPQRTGHWKTSTRNASTETPAAGHAAQACNCLKVRTPHR